MTAYPQGATYFAAAASLVTPGGAATDQGRVNELLHRGDAGVSRGGNLMSAAMAHGAVIGSQG